MSEITHYREHEIKLASIAAGECSGVHRGGVKAWMIEAFKHTDMPRSRRAKAKCVLTYILEWMRPRKGQEDVLYPARYTGERFIVHRSVIMEELDVSRPTYHRVLSELMEIGLINCEPLTFGIQVSLHIEGFIDFLSIGLAETILSKQSYYKSRKRYDIAYNKVRSIYPEVADAVQRRRVANGG